MRVKRIMIPDCGMLDGCWTPHIWRKIEDGEKCVRCGLTISISKEKV